MATSNEFRWLEIPVIEYFFGWWSSGPGEPAEVGLWERDWGVLLVMNESGGSGGTPTIGPAAEPVKPPPPQPDTRPYCADIFSDAFLGGLLGSGASTYAKGEAAEQALQAGSQAYAAKALEHHIERRLVVPLRSSIVRRLFLGARALGFVAEMVPWGVAAYEILPAEYQSVKAAVKGECRGVF